MLSRTIVLWINLALWAHAVDYDLETNVPRESWAQPDTSAFNVRGATYFNTKKKVQAGEPNFLLVGIDLFSFENYGEQINVGARPESATNRAKEYTFIINLMIPGPGNLALVMYFQAANPHIWTSNPLLRSFIEGDDEYRNSRFKLIPRIAKGSYIIKRAVGSSPALVSQKLKTTYTRSDRYFEIDLDIGSNPVARTIVGMVRGASKAVSVDMAFLVESKIESELPEQILGAANLNYISLNNPVRISSREEEINAGDWTDTFSKGNTRPQNEGEINVGDWTGTFSKVKVNTGRRPQNEEEINVGDWTGTFSKVKVDTRTRPQNEEEISVGDWTGTFSNFP